MNDPLLLLCYMSILLQPMCWGPWVDLGPA